MGKHSTAVCIRCRKEMRSDNIQRHSMVCKRGKAATDKQIQCPICKGAYTKKNLRTHIKSQHKDLAPKPLKELRAMFSYIS